MSNGPMTAWSFRLDRADEPLLKSPDGNHDRVIVHVLTR
ncbi:hypothetical protein HTIA_2330 [Halorhabdus tiamatea SARL4B]|uniref:Uncharacterized protein n=1 Tax=Halorhabdus tiamatea SARL4B TaxID=1033806 RepID=S6D1V2_9EURY|nr:hypothetical protein HTIA_2330 [Halorhabdus tiamatea SARL4B]